MKEKKENSIEFNDLENKNILSVPDNYFQSLPPAIISKIALRNVNLNKPIYRVPEGYFHKMHQQILHRTIGSGLLSDNNLKENIFKAPPFYFEELNLSKEIKSTSENGFPAQNIFAVPEGYFEISNANILDKIDKKPKVIHVDFMKSEPWRAGIAAVLLLGMMVSILFYSRKNSLNEREISTNPGEGIAQSLLANLAKNEIRIYLEKQYHLDNQELIEFSTEAKKMQIQDDFEKDLLSFRLETSEKKELENELNEMDISELDTDI